ncbi:hypothetical protein [Acetobacterium sp.]|uniref:hypothetical protein n=1 Tax=Acetobacterium sp. TaxID=1872094 RepID=UPI003593BFF3
MNQKRHMDMTAEEKANIATCTGKKDEHPCKNPVFRCLECGNYGCDQEILDKCTEQGFKNGKCLHCGATSTRIPVMKDEMAEFIAQWEKEVPGIES